MLDRVKQLANQKGMSLNDISLSVIVPRCQITNSLKNNPTLRTMEKVAKALNVEVSDLFPRKVSGYLEYNGKIVAIRTVEDLENVLDELKK